MTKDIGGVLRILNIVEMDRASEYSKQTPIALQITFFQKTRKLGKSINVLVSHDAEDIPSTRADGREIRILTYVLFLTKLITKL